MTMLAEVVDAVIGIDTHRDSHEVEIAGAAGRPIRRCGSATTPRGSPSCWPRSPHWRPGRAADDALLPSHSAGGPTQGRTDCVYTVLTDLLTTELDGRGRGWQPEPGEQGGCDTVDSAGRAKSSS